MRTRFRRKQQRVFGKGKPRNSVKIALGGIALFSFLCLALGLLWTSDWRRATSNVAPAFGTELFTVRMRKANDSVTELLDDIQLKLEQYLVHEEIEKAIQKFEKELTKRKISFEGEGNSYGTQRYFYTDLARQMAELRLADDSDIEWVYVCETGFNVGHSAVTFLSAHPRIKYVGFDILKDKNLGKLAEETKLARLKTVEYLYGAERIEVNWGDSRQTMAAYNRTDFCSVLVVDGGHANDVPSADLSNFESMCIPKAHVLVIDDICTNAPWCKQPTKAWETAIAQGRVQLIGSMRDWTPLNHRGWEWGRYVRAHRPALDSGTA